jgi:hypothetical protein
MHKHTLNYRHKHAENKYMYKEETGSLSAKEIHIKLLHKSILRRGTLFK